MLEALHIPQEEKFAEAIREDKSIQECILLQTCHRVEIFYISADPNHEEKTKQALKLWSTKTGVSNDLISRAVQIYHGKEALRHLFYLACGIESVVLGEDQILGQVRTAWLKAKANETCGPIFDKAFMKAINVGRKVRKETKINEGSVSISSAAVDLATRELGDLTSKKALIVGAGEAGSLAAEALRSKAVSTIMVANRTYKKSLTLAQKISGEAIQFGNVLSTVPQVDLVIAAVKVTQPLFREEQFTPFSAYFGNPHPLLLIDISQPRAIEEKIGSLQGINLKTIDDLKELITQNMRNRGIAAEKSKAIVSAELDLFEAELSKLVAKPIIQDICRKFEAIRKKELNRAIHKMKESDEKKLLVLDRFSRELTERIAQIPIEQLRAAALSNDGELLSMAEKIFQTKMPEPNGERFLKSS
jgi:glutamyl-tRNA reductase